MYQKFHGKKNYYTFLRIKPNSSFSKVFPIDFLHSTHLLTIIVMEWKYLSANSFISERTTIDYIENQYRLQPILPGKW